MNLQVNPINASEFIYYSQEVYSFIFLFQVEPHPFLRSRGICGNLYFLSVPSRDLASLQQVAVMLNEVFSFGDSI